MTTRKENTEDGPVNFEVTFAPQESIREFIDLLCDAYKMTGSFTLAEIERFVREKRTEHPDKILFASLDDFRQASYTSGHATGTHELDDVSGHDLSSLDQGLLEDGEHPGYLSTSSEFFIRYENFRRQTTQEDFIALRRARWWSDQNHPLPSILVGDGVEKLHRETCAYVQIVPVQYCYEALCAFPNGYFIDDFSPFENHLIAKHLYDVFNFVIFGIGACYLGFLRQRPLEGSELDALVKFLSSLYDTDENIEAVIKDLLAGCTSFYLGYNDR